MISVSRYDKHIRGENLNKEAVVETLGRKWDDMKNHLDERGRRMWAAAAAQAIGHGGVTIVHEATGRSRSVITQGIAEMARPQDAGPPDRSRMAGGGWKETREQYPGYEQELENLLDASVIGDLGSCKQKRAECFRCVKRQRYRSKL